jgi:hypothetical protein
MLTPNAEHAEVPGDKVSHYLLSLTSEEGRGKAVFFLSKGFSPDNWSELANALLEHVRSNHQVQHSQTQWGTKYVVEGPLQCPDGSTATIRTVWNIKDPHTHPRLVTAYPLPRPKEEGPSQ